MTYDDHYAHDLTLSIEELKEKFGVWPTRYPLGHPGRKLVYLARDAAKTKTWHPQDNNNTYEPLPGREPELIYSEGVNDEEMHQAVQDRLSLLLDEEDELWEN